jgi:hypothetical protein
VTAQVGQNTKLNATCPAGKSVFGGGYINPDTRGTANTVIASYPLNQTTWEVVIFNPSGSSTFAVQAYAVCAAIVP